MSGLTLEIVTRALFGTGALDNAEEFRRSVDVAIHYANHLLYSFLPLPIWVPTPRHLRAFRAGLVLRRTLDGIVAERRRRGEEGDDLLAMLIAARDDESHEGMDDAQLRDELVTFINAGHETTAVALAWTWYLISRHPEVERRLHAELAEVLGGRTPTSGDLSDLVYTRCVIEESMRLYPPAWGMGRESYEADEIGGYRIEARSGVFLCPYLTHRHTDF